METRTITFIQFQSGIDYTGGYDDVSRRQVYILVDLDDSYEFHMGEDDDGDDMFEDRSAISVCDCMEDYLAERHYYYVATRGLVYSLIEVEVEIDEDGKPIFKVA